MNELPANVDPENLWLLDEDGNAVINDETGEIVIWSEGMPTEPAFYKFATAPIFETTWRFDVANAAHIVPVLDEGGNPTYDQSGNVIVESVTRDLVIFVRKADISREEAWLEFTKFTLGKYSNAVQTEYKPTLLRLQEDWTTGLGTVIYPR